VVEKYIAWNQTKITTIDMINISLAENANYIALLKYRLSISKIVYAIADSCSGLKSLGGGGLIDWVRSTGCYCFGLYLLTFFQNGGIGAKPN
jgi:hypothetical protein